MTFCHQILTSRIFLSNAYNVTELSWDELEMTGVNRMYDNITNTTKFCFDDVNESFLFLEYCDVGEQFGCMMSGSIFCCNWVEFVSRTHVNVIGDSSMSYSHTSMSYSYTSRFMIFHCANILSYIQNLVVMIIIL